MKRKPPYINTSLTGSDYPSYDDEKQEGLESPSPAPRGTKRWRVEQLAIGKPAPTAKKPGESALEKPEPAPSYRDPTTGLSLSGPGAGGAQTSGPARSESLSPDGAQAQPAATPTSPSPKPPFSLAAATGTETRATQRAPESGEASTKEKADQEIASYHEMFQARRAAERKAREAAEAAAAPPRRLKADKVRDDIGVMVGGDAFDNAYGRAQADDRPEPARTETKNAKLGFEKHSEAGDTQGATRYAVRLVEINEREKGPAAPKRKPARGADAPDLPYFGNLEVAADVGAALKSGDEAYIRKTEKRRLLSDTFTPTAPVKLPFHEDDPAPEPKPEPDWSRPPSLRRSPPEIVTQTAQAEGLSATDVPLQGDGIGVDKSPPSSPAEGPEEPPSDAAMIGRDEAGGWTIDTDAYAALPPPTLTLERATEIVAEAAQRRAVEHLDAVSDAAAAAGSDYLSAAEGAGAAVREAAGWVFGETEAPEWVREAKARAEAALDRRIQNAGARIEERVEQIEGVLEDPAAALAEIEKAAERLQGLGAAVQAWAGDLNIDKAMVELMLDEIGAMGVDLAIETADNHPIFAIGGVLLGDGRRRRFSLRDFNTRLEELERVAKAMGDQAGARAIKKRKRQKHRDASGEFDEGQRAAGRDDIRESGQDADFWLWNGAEARRAGFNPPFPKVRTPPKGDVGRPTPNYGQLDKLKRATSASALIPKGGVPKGSKVSETEVVGFENDPQIVRAHLLRRIFGGTGKDERNLTPLSRFDNHPVMYMIETSLERAVRTQNVQIEVRPIYRRKGQRPGAQSARLRPVAIVVSARGSRGYSIDYLVPNIEKGARDRRSGPRSRRGRFSPSRRQ